MVSMNILLPLSMTSNRLEVEDTGAGFNAVRCRVRCWYFTFRPQQYENLSENM